MRFVFAIVLAGTILGCQAQESKHAGASSLATKRDSVSYVIGLNVGRSLSHDSIDINHDAFVCGMKDAALDSSKRYLSQEAVESTMKVFQEEMMVKQQSNARAQGMNNKAEGDAFLASNKTKEGVVTLPDGLQYKVIKEGHGAIPKADQTVTVNYKGSFLNGQEFDSSYKRGKPASFPCSRVIRGWTEALLKMKIGSKWILWIPPELAYGESGYGGGTIPPNATLTFEVELLSAK